MISERSNPYYYAIYYSEYSCRKFFFFFRFHTFSHYILAFLVLVLSRRRPLRFFPPEQRKQTNFSFFPYLRGSFSSRRALGDREFCNNINTNFSNSIDHRFFHHFWQKQKKNKTKKEKNMMNSVRSFFTFVPHRIPEARAARVPQ